MDSPRDTRSPSQPLNSSSEEEEGEEFQAFALERKKKRKQTTLHSERLHAAMDALRIVLDEIRCRDPPPPQVDGNGDDQEQPKDDDETSAEAEAEVELQDSDETEIFSEEGETCHEQGTEGIASASDQPPTVMENASEQQTVDKNAMNDDDPNEHDVTVSKDVEAPHVVIAGGPILEMQREVLRTYDNAYPPLGVLRRVHVASNGVPTPRKHTIQNNDRAAMSHHQPTAAVEPTLSSTDQKKIDLYRRREWISLPDDPHLLHCALEGLDPTSITSRKKKKKWFDGKPIYSSAVLLLAQVSQQQLQAMKKKHDKKGKGKVLEAGGADDEGLSGGKTTTMSLDPPLIEKYHPIPKLGRIGYYDNDLYPLQYNDTLTPPEVATLLQRGEQQLKGVDRLQSMVSFRRRSVSFEPSDIPDIHQQLSNSFRNSGSGGTASQLEVAVEELLQSARRCTVVSTTDVAVAFSLFPATPALQLFKPRKRNLGGSPLSLCDAHTKKFALTWVDHWKQYLSGEERRYANPRTVANMYQALVQIHPNGAECRLWVVKRIVRWILKAKRSLLRFTLLRCRLVFSSRKPRGEYSSILVPPELTIAAPEATSSPPTFEARDGRAETNPLDDSDVNSSTQPPQEPSSLSQPPDDDEELNVDPLPLNESGGILLVRSSARVELLHNETLSLPAVPPTGEQLSEDAKDALRKAIQERTAAEVVVNAVVVPTFDPLSNQSEVARAGSIVSESRTAAPDSFIETLANKLCDIVINLESELRHKKNLADELAVDVYREIVEQRARDAGVLNPRKRRAAPRQDGVQLGLIKSSVAAEAQERANPLGGAIQVAMKQFREFVVRNVILAPKTSNNAESSGKGSVTPQAAEASSHAASPGIVSLREVLCAVFRDEHHTRPKWTDASSSPPPKPNAETHNNNEETEEDGGSPHSDQEATALKQFLKPVLVLDSIASGNVKSVLPQRLFHPLHMNVLQNMHSYDDNSLFNLRRRERCCTSESLIEEISELFQRLVEIIHNVDSMSQSGKLGEDSATQFSKAVAHRRARRDKQHAAATTTATTPSSSGRSLTRTATNEPLVPRKQFGSVLRVLIDRMVRRLLVNMIQLMRMLTCDGKQVTTSILDQVSQGIQVVSPVGRNPPALDATARPASGAPSTNSRRTSAVSVSLGVAVQEPGFCMLAERAIVMDGPGADHHFADFFVGWKWFSQHPHVARLIWGPGKDHESDRDRLYDQLYEEMKNSERGRLAAYSAFGTGGDDDDANHSAAGLSILKVLGTSVSSSLSVSAPVAVAECLDLDSQELDDICSLFPTVENASELLHADVDATGRAILATKPTESSNGTSTINGGAVTTTISLGDFLQTRGESQGVSKQDTSPKLSSYIGETQFLFTILHILDLCHVVLDAQPSIDVDGAAHLRGDSVGGRKLGAAKRKGVGSLLSVKGKGGPKSTRSHLVNHGVFDVRDSMFFRWRFHVSLRQDSLTTDVRHCMLSLFEKHVASDLLVDSLSHLKASLRHYYVNEEEALTIAQLQRDRERYTSDVAEESNTAEIQQIGGGDDERIKNDKSVADILRRRAVEKQLGVYHDMDRSLRVNAIMSRLKMVVRSFTREARCLMEGVKELLDMNPPAERTCYALIQQMFRDEFEKWDAYKSLAITTNAAAMSSVVSPRDSVMSGGDPLSDSRRATDTELLSPSMSSRAASVSPGGGNNSVVSIPPIHTSTPGRAVDESTSSSFTSPKETVGALRCEQCHQVPRGIMFRHKNQPRKVSVPITEDELMFDGDTSARERASRSGSLRSLPDDSNRISVSDKRKKEMMRKNMTKLVTQYVDFFVCSDCLAKYIAYCMVRRLIDSLHAAMASEAAEVAAAAAAQAEQMRRKIQEEIFGNGLIAEEVTPEMFEHVQQEVRKREEEAKKRAAMRLENNDEDDDDEDGGDDDEGEAKGFFGVQKRKKKKKKSRKGGDDDDDDLVALAPVKSKKKKRNHLEEKLAQVMIGVQREQWLVQESKDRLAIKKEALAEFNKVLIERAKDIYVRRHGVEPDTLDDLVNDQSLVLESESEEENTSDEKQLKEQQAEAEKLMTMAKQQSQSKLTSFRKAASMVGRAATSVKFLTNGSISGSDPTIALEGGGGSLSKITSFISSGLSSPLDSEDIDEFGLPPLRSKSGYTINQLREQIQKDEQDLEHNKLAYLKKDLEEKIKSLQNLKNELGSLIVKQDERRAEKEKENQDKEETLKAKQEEEKKRKKAEVLRAVAEKFKKNLPKSHGSNSTSIGGSTQVRATESMSPDEIIALAKEAVEQQSNTMNRLLRGESRRTLLIAPAEVNLFDDEGLTTHQALPASDVDENNTTPATRRLDSKVQRRLAKWNWMIDGFEIPPDEVLHALRVLCTPSEENRLVRFHVQCRLVKAKDSFSPLSRDDEEEEEDERLELPADWVESLRQWKTFMEAQRASKVSPTLPLTASLGDINGLDDGGEGHASVAEWFGDGESDDLIAVRDDSLVLFSHLNRLEPLSLFLSNEPPEDALQSLVLQCSFVEESVCMLLDMACRMLPRVDMNPHHMEGYLAGVGGGMLESFGMHHPYEQEVFQVLGAPTNSAAMYHATKMLKEQLRTNASTPGGGGAEGLSSAKAKYSAEQHFGDANRQLIKFGRQFLHKTSVLRRRVPANTVVTLNLLRQINPPPALAQSLGQAEGAELPASPDVDEDPDNGFLPQSPLVASLADLHPESDESEADEPFAASKRPLSSDGVMQSFDVAEDPDGNIRQPISPWDIQKPGSGGTNARVVNSGNEGEDVNHNEEGNESGNDHHDQPFQSDIQSGAEFHRRASKQRRRRKSTKKRHAEPVASSNAEYSEEKHQSSVDAQAGGDGPRARRGFRERLQEGVVRASAQEDRLLGCLAEMRLPAIELIAPSSDVHPSLTQAWWQIRLLALAILRFYIASSILSYRAIWSFTWRSLARQLRRMCGAQSDEQRVTLLKLFAKPFKWIVVDEAVQPPMVGRGGYASPWKNQPDECHSSQAGSGSFDPGATFNSEFSNTLTSLPGNENTSVDGSPKVDSINDSLPPHGTLTGPAVQPLPRCAPKRVKQYLNTKRKWSTDEETLHHRALSLYHAHTALGYVALEEYSLGLVKSFSRVKGTHLLGNQRECLRIASRSVLQKLRECIWARASEAFDGDAGSAETARRSQSVAFLEDMGRVALALFVLGPLADARSVLTLNGFESFNIQKDRDGLSLQGSLSGCAEVITFVEEHLFRGDGRTGSPATEANTKATNNDHDHPTFNSPDDAHSSPPSENRESQLAEAIASESMAPMEGWKDDEAPPASVSTSRAASPSSKSVATPAATTTTPNGGTTTTTTGIHDDVSEEVSSFHQRLLRIVNKLLYRTDEAQLLPDHEYLRSLLESSVHAFFYEMPKTQLYAYGAQLILYAFSSGVEGDDVVTPLGRITVSLKGFSDAYPSVVDEGAAYNRQRRILNSLYVATDSVKASLQRQETRLDAMSDRRKAFAAAIPAALVKATDRGHRDASLSVRPTGHSRMSRSGGNSVLVDSCETPPLAPIEPIIRGFTSSEVVSTRRLLTAVGDALDEVFLTPLKMEAATNRSRNSSMWILNLLPLPCGDTYGGSSILLHRALSESLPSSQLQAQEELRKRQRRFESKMFDVLQEAASVESTRFYTTMGLEPPPKLETQWRPPTTDTEWWGNTQDGMAKRPTDLLRNPRVAYSSLNAEQLQEQHNEDDNGAREDGSPLTGHANAPFRRRSQMGSMFMERLLQKASDRGNAKDASKDDDGMSASGRRGTIITSENVQFIKSVNSTLSDVRLAAIAAAAAAEAGSRPSSSLNATLTELRRMVFSINNTVGGDLPPGRRGPNAGVSAAMAFDELQRLVDDEKRTKKPQGDGAADNATKVHARTLSLFGDEADMPSNDEDAYAAASEDILRRRSIKEMSEAELLHYQRRHRHDALGLLDATGLLKTVEKPSNEFFVPFMSVAYQLMELSDRTRSELYRHIPPQCVEDGDVFMMLQLKRREADLEPVIRGAFLYDTSGTITADSVPQSQVANLFATCTPENFWTPTQENTARTTIPWVECTVSRRKGVLTLTSAIGEYRMSIRMLQILVASADSPTVYQGISATPMDGLHGILTSPSLVPNHDGEAEESAAFHGMPDKQDLCSAVDDAALSAILQRRAMLRRFFMPSSTHEGTRISYTSSVPYDPDAAVKTFDMKTPIDWSLRFRVETHERPAGLLDSVMDLEISAKEYTNVDVTAYDTESAKAKKLPSTLSSTNDARPVRLLPWLRHSSGPSAMSPSTPPPAASSPSRSEQIKLPPIAKSASHVATSVDTSSSCRTLNVKLPLEQRSKGMDLRSMSKKT